MEVLHFLKYDHWEVAKILRVEFNEPNVSIEEIFHDRLIEAQILEQEKEKKTGREIHTYFIKARSPLMPYYVMVMTGYTRSPQVPLQPGTWSHM